MSHQPKRVLIVGASARAAAVSAARSGAEVFALDLFADTDLCARARAQRIESGYPQQAVSLARDLPEMPWMYTGGIENHPDVIEAIAKDRPLLGNGPLELARVRAPDQLSRIARTSDCHFPDTRYEPPSQESHDAWLRKPLASTGGIGIMRANRRPVETNEAGEFIWQRYVPGSTQSAVYVADGRECRLLGISQQMLAHQRSPGSVKAGRSPFAYVGSRGPLQLPPVELQHWAQLGRALTRQCQLTGVFGVDGVVDAAGNLTLIEVNPRYTASMELIEMATGQSIFQLHVAGCRGHLPPHPSAGTNRPRCFTKSYIFADQPITVSQTMVDRLMREPDLSNGWPSVADIPRVGIKIEPAQPIHTQYRE